jgi:hypothetical protein
VDRRFSQVSSIWSAGAFPIFAPDIWQGRSVLCPKGAGRLGPQSGSRDVALSHQAKVASFGLMNRVRGLTQGAIFCPGRIDYLINISGCIPPAKRCRT